MRIDFNKVKIKNFQSILSGEIILDNQGIVLVKGINKYENNADSNGSGKSSCFESILWALFGKTSNSITDPTNRNSGGICEVELDFNIDNNNYKIIRQPKILNLYHNGNDISCRTKTDTDKLIKDILVLNQDTFLSTVFLSQGFGSRLSILAPSGRKERIETLTGISDKVEKFKSKISNAKSYCGNEISKCENDISYINGAKETTMLSLNNLIDKLQKICENNDDVDVNELKNNLTESKDKLKILNDNEKQINSDISNIKLQNSQCKSKIQQLNSDISKIENNMLSVSDNICPTCKTNLSVDTKKDLLETYQLDIKNKKSSLNDIEKEYKITENKINELNNDLSIVLEKSNKLKSIVETLTNDIEKYQELLKAPEIENDIRELKQKVYDLDLKLDNGNENLLQLNNKFDILNNCLKFISKDYRTYLLTNIIQYINKQLDLYSKMLFSNNNDIIKLDSDTNKLDIYLNNAIYESLSGGEKRKVDIALTFAQKDLLLDITGISTNLIMLDEVMDNLDKTATDSVLDMMQLVAENISSMFIISHNNYNIPFDKIISVVKDLDKNSKIMVV